MWVKLLNFIKPPEEKEHAKKLLLGNLFFTIRSLFSITIIAAVIALLVGRNLSGLYGLMIEGFTFGILIFLARRTYIAAAGWILTILFWFLGLTLGVISGGDPAYFIGSIFLVTIVASMLIGSRGTLIVSIFSLVEIILLSFANHQGRTISTELISPASLIIIQILFWSISAYFLVYSSRTTLSYAKLLTEKDKELVETNDKVITSRNELIYYSKDLEEKNRDDELLSELTRISIFEYDENTLLENISTLLSERLHIPQLSVYTLIDSKEYMYMRSYKNLSGKFFDPESYKLRVSRNEIDLNPTNNQAQSIKFSSQGTSYTIESPDILPNLDINRSYPIAIGSTLYGLLNIQNNINDDQFDRNSLLNKVADQIAIILFYTRLNKADIKQEEVSKDLGVGTTQAPWSSINAGSTMGYKYDQISLVPFKDSLQPEILSELLKGKSIQYKPIGEKSINRLIAPILIRDELIGVIGYDKDDMDQDWQRDEIIMLEMVSTQMGLVLENNRLFAAAQLRLKREQLLGEMTSHIRETLDLDTVLKTAVRELRQAFNLDEVEVRLGAPQDGSITINGGSR
jgi:hypothetical protein